MSKRNQSSRMMGVGSVPLDPLAEQALIAHGTGLEVTVEPRVRGCPQKGEQRSRARGEQKTLFATGCGPDMSGPQARAEAKILLRAEGFFDGAAFGVELDDRMRSGPGPQSPRCSRSSRLTLGSFQRDHR